jgi:hypothetical protein
MRFSSGFSVRVFVISYDVFGLKDLVEGRRKRKTVDDDGREKFAYPEDIACSVGNVTGKVDLELKPYKPFAAVLHC